MRAALWLLALFGVAVAVALFAGNNQGTVTLFWPPYRVDLSLNLVLLLLLAAFLFLHAALGALSALFDLPRQALRWRTQQKERAMHAALLDDASGDPSAVTRDYLRESDSAGAPLLSIWGGKITTFRKLAEEAADQVGRMLGEARKPWTERALLPGGDLSEWIGAPVRPDTDF